jgi:hypothetical protein
MKLSVRLTLLVCMLVSFAITSLAFAADGAKMSAPGKATFQKLPNIIKINPADLSGVKMAEISMLSDAFYAAWKRVNDSCKYTATELPMFEQQAKDYIAKSQECKNKSYSQQDMNAAGCVASDTVADCSKKLYSWCMISNNAQIPVMLDMLMNLTVIRDYSNTSYNEFYKSVQNILHK